jgi:hypothetical protein
VAGRLRPPPLTSRNTRATRHSARSSSGCAAGARTQTVFVTRPIREPCLRRARCRRRSDRLATGTAAPGAVIGERAEQADAPARRAAPPGDRGEEQEHERDRANDGDQHDREHRRSQADRASEEMLANRTARKRRARRTRWFWRDLALCRHRTLVTRRGRARITRSPSPRGRPTDGRGRWLDLWLRPVIGLCSDTLLETSGLRDCRTREPDLRTYPAWHRWSQWPRRLCIGGRPVGCHWAPLLPSTAAALGSGRRRSSAATLIGADRRDWKVAKAMARFSGGRRLNALVDSAVFVAETTALVPGCESTVLTA